MAGNIERAGRRLLAGAMRSIRGSSDAVGSIPAGTRLRSILLMRWDAVGDLMVCLPWFRKTREVFPRARVGIVVSRRNRDLLKYEPEFTAILYDSEPATYLRSLLLARRFRPNAVVDTRMHYDSTTSFIYGVVSGAEWMLSADNRTRRLPFNVRVPMPTARMHNSDMTRLLLCGLGRDIPDADLDREVRLSTAELDFADGFWRTAGLRYRGRTVGINISARDPLHSWPLAGVRELCTLLVGSGRKPVLFSVPSEHSEVTALAVAVPGTLAAPPCPGILHAAALIRDMAMFVTPDTGLVHVASSYGVPTVGLYVPNEEHLPLWFPWRVENEVLMGEGAVSSIAVGDVMDAVERLSCRTRAQGTEI
ncbi:MAG: hypothetical protein AVO35_10505 [Candidatus Aegiribacteria sp. MLS_C]|nr:MAG: hypothetical protein AVO35_10505 [Candidatus Aegiribacteria sp. MLS_C]